jgi:hypothetical protein
VTGTIQLKTGIPRRLTLSRDRSRFYIIDAPQEKVEVVDVASKTTLDTFTLTEGTNRIRINSLEPDPTHSYAILLTAAAPSCAIASKSARPRSSSTTSRPTR